LTGKRLVRGEASKVRGFEIIAKVSGRCEGEASGEDDDDFAVMSRNAGPFEGDLESDLRN
jgi:hypothetical protein